MNFRCGDPLSDFDALEREKDRMLELLPICDGENCGKHIDDEYCFEIDGETLCLECVISRYGRKTRN